MECRLFGEMSMPRIQCNCGKMLKVGDALIGKKIKCPVCGAVQAVTDVAPPVSSNKSASASEDFANPPSSPRKAPKSARSDAMAPKERKRGEVEEGDQTRRKKKQ